MIILFSGTGNSRMVARLLSRPDEKIVDAAHLPADTLEVSAGERVVWIFPVYAWGMPGVVTRFIRRVSLSDNEVPHFMVCTCGDDIGLTHLQWRREIRRRGWRGVATFSVRMPNTYVLLPGFDTDSPLVVAEKLAACPARVAEIDRAIRHQARVDDVVRGAVPWIKSRILRPLFNTFLMSPRPFHATRQCVGCGKCVTHCPMGNITMSGNRHPSWGRNCAMCLECYHCCPHHAVAYGCLSKGKGQYSGPEGVIEV